MMPPAPGDPMTATMLDYASGVTRIRRSLILASCMKRLAISTKIVPGREALESWLSAGPAATDGAAGSHGGNPLRRREARNAPIVSASFRPILAATKHALLRFQMGRCYRRGHYQPAAKAVAMDLTQSSSSTSAHALIRCPKTSALCMRAGPDTPIL